MQPLSACDTHAADATRTRSLISVGSCACVSHRTPARLAIPRAAPRPTRATPRRAVSVSRAGLQMPRLLRAQRPRAQWASFRPPVTPRRRSTWGTVSARGARFCKRRTHLSAPRLDPVARLARVARPARHGAGERRCRVSLTLITL